MAWNERVAGISTVLGVDRIFGIGGIRMQRAEKGNGITRIARTGTDKDG